MARINDNPIEQISGFFKALFGACMVEDRKGDKRKPTIQNLGNRPQGNILGNFLDSMTINPKELKEVKEDFGQFIDSTRHREGGAGTFVSQVSKEITGQNPPGLLMRIVDAGSGRIPKYALPLDEGNRTKIIDLLTKYSKEYSSNSNPLSIDASNIAAKLSEKNADGLYKYRSLATASDSAGMPKRRIRQLYEKLQNLLNKNQKRRIANRLKPPYKSPTRE